MKVSVLFITALLFIGSCGGITKEEFEKRVSGLESRMAQLEERQKVLEERNLRTESRVDNLAENIASLRLEVERLKLSKSMPPPPIKVPKKEEEKPAPDEEKKQEGKNPTPVEAKPVEASKPALSEEQSKAYEEALKLYNLKQLHQARDKFVDYIKKYPQTPLTDNAYLWLGIIYRDLGELNKAEAVWLTLVERCRRKEMVDCNKAPSALLQLARLYEQKGDHKKAMEFYEAILKEYPLSEEAGLAKTKLGR